MLDLNIRKLVNKRKKVIKRLARLPAASLNYHLDNYKDVVWVGGDGRSGTTWLSDLINWDKKYRELFEPLHPGFVKEAELFGFSPYIRPEDNSSPVSTFLLHSVLSGKFKHFRTDVSKPQLLYKGLLIKEIFANLLMGWLHRNAPDTKKILIIRNPFAVALSKQCYRHWMWMTDPKQFLDRKLLMSDYLMPFEHLIAASKDDFIENQILIWAIIHFVPFQQLEQDDVYVLFYEHLFLNPEEEIAKIFKYLYDTESNVLDGALLSKIRKPSRTQGRKFSTLSAASPLDIWKGQLQPAQIDSGMKILEAFGLDSIYSADSMPAADAFHKLFAHHKTD